MSNCIYHLFHDRYFESSRCYGFVVDGGGYFHEADIEYFLDHLCPGSEGLAYTGQTSDIHLLNGSDETYLISRTGSTGLCGILHKAGERQDTVTHQRTGVRDGETSAGGGVGDFVYRVDKDKRRPLGDEIFYVLISRTHKN